MNAFSLPSWSEILTPDKPFLELFLRGTAIYLFLFTLFRIIRRQAGSLAISDLLLVVLVADASQNAMTGDYRSLPDGLVLLVTLFFWDFCLDWMAFRFPRFGRLIHPPPFPLVQNGTLVPRNLRKEMISKDELMSYIRAQGLADLSDVETAYIEGNGHISVIPKKRG